GAATALSANLIDGGQSITSGASISLTGATGGTTHISTATVALSETITPVNDAPVASGSATLIAIAEDMTTSAGATVSSLFATNFADVDGDALSGIAISAYSVDATKGNWQYSSNGGSSWTTLGSASTTAAVTLKATDLLRFVPAANYNGAATAL